MVPSFLLFIFWDLKNEDKNKCGPIIELFIACLTWPNLMCHSRPFSLFLYHLTPPVGGSWRIFKRTVFERMTYPEKIRSTYYENFDQLKKHNFDQVNFGQVIIPHFISDTNKESPITLLPFYFIYYYNQFRSEFGSSLSSDNRSFLTNLSFFQN
jgi:hypothetical protein